MSTKGSNSNFIFGGIAIFSIIGVFATAYYWNTLFPTKKQLANNTLPIKNNKTLEVKKSEDENKDEEGDEDGEDDEDDNEEEDQEEKESVVEDNDQSDKVIEKSKEAETAELRTQYDDCIRLAKKLLAGNSYLRAAEKFKEAIKLVENVPSASKDLITLYNNTSAMYEKAGNYEESLLDINIVLHMDSRHSKARLRKARILEIQEHYSKSLHEYVLCMLLDQERGEQPSVAATTAVDKLSKIIGAKEAVKIVRKMKANQLVLPEPPKSFCKQFFENFSSLYKWTLEYENADREELAVKVKDIDINTIDSTNADVLTSAFKTIHDLIIVDFVGKRFTKAFELLLSKSLTTKLSQLATTFLLQKESTLPYVELKKQLSLYIELLGSYDELMGRFGNASDNYKASLDLWPDNLDAKLKQLFLLVEFGDVAEAESSYTEIIDKLYPLISQPQPAVVESVHSGNDDNDNDKDKKDTSNTTIDSANENTSSSASSSTTAESESESVDNKENTSSSGAATTELPSLQSQSQSQPSINIDNNSNDNVEQQHPRVFPVTSDHLVKVAWMIVHRAGIFNTRNNEGVFRYDAVDKMKKDIDLVRKLTQAVVDDESEKSLPYPLSVLDKEMLKGARYAATFKYQYGSAQIFSQLGINTTDKQKSFSKLITEESKALFPKSDNIILQELDDLTSNDQFDEALTLIEKGIQDNNGMNSGLDCTYALLKANIKMQLAFGLLQDPHAYTTFPAAMKEVTKMYEDAMKFESFSSEPITPYVQLKTMLGEFEEGFEIAEKATKLARTREEAQDVFQLWATTKAQKEAIAEIKSPSF